MVGRPGKMEPRSDIPKRREELQFNYPRSLRRPSSTADFLHRNQGAVKVKGKLAVGWCLFGDTDNLWHLLPADIRAFPAPVLITNLTLALIIAENTTSIYHTRDMSGNCLQDEIHE